MEATQIDRIEIGRVETPEAGKCRPDAADFALR